jgi:hypothetical protein
VIAVDDGQHVRRRDHDAATIVARRGRVVASRLQSRTSPRNGLSLALATAATSEYWDFPDGAVGDSVAERFHVYNPSKKDAAVQLALTLDQGAAEPFELKVPAGERLTFDPASESRVPKGVGHAATVTSNVAVIVERTLDYASSAGGRLGLSIAPGATHAAAQWLLPQGGVSDAQQEWVVVHNPGRRTVKFTIAAPTGGHRVGWDGVRAVTLRGGQRRNIFMGDIVTRPDLPLLVDATGPVIVERILARIGRSGVSQMIGIPVGAR